MYRDSLGAEGTSAGAEVAPRPQEPGTFDADGEHFGAEARRSGPRAERSGAEAGSPARKDYPHGLIVPYPPGVRKPRHGTLLAHEPGAPVRKPSTSAPKL